MAMIARNYGDSLAQLRKYGTVQVMSVLRVELFFDYAVKLKAVQSAEVAPNGESARGGDVAMGGRVILLATTDRTCS